MGCCFMQDFFVLRGHKTCLLVLPGARISLVGTARSAYCTSLSLPLSHSLCLPLSLAPSQPLPFSPFVCLSLPLALSAPLPYSVSLSLLPTPSLTRHVSGHSGRGSCRLTFVGTSSACTHFFISSSVPCSMSCMRECVHTHTHTHTHTHIHTQK